MTYPYPQMGVPREPRRVGLTVSIVAGALAYAVLAATIGLIMAHGHLPSSTAQSAVDHGGDLRRFLLPAPVDATPVDDNLGLDGTFDADAESQLYTDPAMRKEVLAEERFETGAVRDWNVHGEVVSIRLYRFAVANDAIGFTAEEANSIDVFHPEAVQTMVSGLKYGRTYVFPGADAKGYFKTLSIAYRGDVVIEIRTYRKVSADLGSGSRLLVEQYARL